MIYLQYLASFIIALIIFYIFYRILKVILYKVDMHRNNKIFKRIEEIKERDRLDEEKGQEERRRNREKELQKRKEV